MGLFHHAKPTAPQPYRLPYALRKKVYQRDGRRCVYCGDTNGPFEIDHVEPRSHGGEDRMNNLVVSCRACNQRKGARVLPGRGTKAKIRAYQKERREYAKQRRRQERQHRWLGLF